MIKLESTWFSLVPFLNEISLYLSTVVSPLHFVLHFQNGHWLPMKWQSIYLFSILLISCFTIHYIYIVETLHQLLKKHTAQNKQRCLIPKQQRHAHAFWTVVLNQVQTLGHIVKYLTNHYTAVSLLYNKKAMDWLLFYVSVTSNKFETRTYNISLITHIKQIMRPKIW